MFGWKLPNAFPMGFMLSAKISQQVRTTLLVRSTGSERPQTELLWMNIIQANWEFTTPNFRIQSWATPIRGSLMRSQPLWLPVKRGK